MYDLSDIETSEVYIQTVKKIERITVLVDFFDEYIDCYFVGWDKDENNYIICTEHVSNAKNDYLDTIENIMNIGFKRDDDEVLGIYSIGLDIGGHHAQEIYKLHQALSQDVKNNTFLLKGKRPKEEIDEVQLGVCKQNDNVLYHIIIDNSKTEEQSIINFAYYALKIREFRDEDFKNVS